MKVKSISSLKRKLDKIFSEYIRIRDRNICFTCGKYANQAGHYVSRSSNSLRYSEINVNAQCLSCNIFKHGNMDIYAINLQARYGNNILKELNRLKNETKQFSIKELELLIERYKNAVG